MGNKKINFFLLLILVLCVAICRFSVANCDAIPVILSLAFAEVYGQNTTDRDTDGKKEESEADETNKFSTKPYSVGID